jgi:hypothetical protein
MNITDLDVTFHHPGLEFLRPMTVFQQRYSIFHAKIVETVVTRLFYQKKHNWRKEMTFSEFQQSGFLECLKLLEKIDDVNSVLLD